MSSNESDPKMDGLSEGQLNANLFRDDIGATVYYRDRTRGHVTPRQIEIGERDTARRNEGVMEVLRRNFEGRLEGINVSFRAVITLPLVPEDPRRDFKGRIEIDLAELGDETFELVRPPQKPVLPTEETA